MRFCLAFMMQNEADWLKLHVPAWLKATSVDGLVAVDGGSTDGGGDYLRSLGATVEYRQWDWKPLDQENAVIELAERAGYDAMLLTAPDELWWAQDIDIAKAALSTQDSALSYRTVNFVKDRLHYAPNAPYWPDPHIRAWRLNQGVRHVGAIDSVPAIPREKVVNMSGLMYHYSSIKDRRFYNWKGHNFHRVKNGQLPLEIPWQEFEPAPLPEHVPYDAPQPLDPQIIGVRAPYHE